MQPDLGQLLQALSSYFGGGQAAPGPGMTGGANPLAQFMAAQPQQAAPQAAAVQAPGVFTLDPNDPASWAAFREKAGAQSAGLNLMPNTMFDTSTLLNRDGNDIYAQFYGQSPIAKARNLGMGE